MIELTATPASPGIAVGPLCLIETEEVVVPNFDDPAGAFKTAVTGATDELRRLQTAAIARGRNDAAEVLEAQALMAEDTMLADAVTEAMASGASLGDALTEATTAIQAIFAGIDDLYIAARADDVGEVSDRIRRHLAGVSSPDLADISEPCILVAAGLTAAETSQLDPEMVLGFAIEMGGPTGHVAIIARSLGLPAVVGAVDLVATAKDCGTVAIDGSAGTIVLDPDTQRADQFAQQAADEKAATLKAEQFRGVTINHDGRKLSIASNIASDADLSRAIDAASEGVGLFRTEFLFLDRDRPPTEEEQYVAYSAAAKAFTEPVVIRTFDIGGDKPARYLNIPTGENPFLDMRGVRLYRQLGDLFEGQLRAALRAAADGDVWLMLPMIATVDEVLEVRRTVDRVAEDLKSAPTPTGTVKIGVMIEVPSAALIAEALAPHVDFFSIGTNDLTQYTLAADRTNSSLDHYQDPVHPAVLKLCAMTVEAGNKHDVSVSVCGLAAADPIAAVLYAGMGMSKLSVTPRSVNPIKAVLADLDPQTAKDALAAALQAPDAATVRKIVATAIGQA